MNTEYQGALLDERPDFEKLKDFKVEGSELAGSSNVVWTEKPVSEWKNYPARNQVSSSSCVAQACSKALFTLGYDITSAHPIYRLRKNFSEKGMWLYDAAEILRKTGTTPEYIAKSQNLGEVEMNRDIEKATIDYLNSSPIKIGAYAYVEKNIEAIAKAVEDNKHCVLTFGASNAEWTDIPEVKGNPVWWHAVCAVDYTIFEGKKYIIIEDSWGDAITRFQDRRLISEEFIKARCTGAMVLFPLVKDEKTAYKFTRILKLGSTGKDVEELQKALKQLGFFPEIQTTKFYGKVTENAVKKFQEAYKSEILTPFGLTKPTGIFGNATMKKLNELNNKWYQTSAGTGELSLTLKGGLVSIIPIVIFVGQHYGVSITEAEITELINAGSSVLAAVMVFVGLARKVYTKFK